MTSVIAVLDFSVFLSPSPETGANYVTYLLGGAIWTVILSVLSWVIAFIIGSMVGVLRTLPSSILSKVGACYVEIFRNIPLLVQLFVWFNVVPDLVPGFGPWFKHLPSFWQQFTSATLCLGLFTAARMAELKSTVFEALLAGTLLYGAINLVVLFLSRALEHSTKLPGLVGAKK